MGSFFSFAFGVKTFSSFGESFDNLLIAEPISKIEYIPKAMTAIHKGDLYMELAISKILIPIGIIIITAIANHSMKVGFDFELVLLGKLGFKLNPPTVAHWAEYYMSQWDVFLDLSFERDLGVMGVLPGKGKFNKGKSDIYHECYQLLDLLVMDPKSLNYDMKGLVLAVLYVILGKEFGVWSLIEAGIRIKQKKLDRNESFTVFFMDFIMKYIVDFNDIVPFLDYLEPFLDLRLCKKRDYKLNNAVEMDLNEFLRFDIDRVQSYNPDWMRILKKLIV